MREIVPLPEVAPLDETPHGVIGVANLRGDIVPVVDLNLRFGRPPRRFSPDDCLIILERSERAVALIVNEVQNVREVAPEDVSPVLCYGAEAPPESRFLAGLLRSSEKVVMLLDLEKLLDLSRSATEQGDAAEIVSGGVSGVFCPDAAPEERAVFEERARGLAQPSESADESALLSLAVVRLRDEYFGIELQSIREFADIRGMTPVPCCPEHIVGQMNLRGDLITLVDVAAALGLRPSVPSADRKVLVVNDAELRAGVLVDEILDVLYVRDADAASAYSQARSPGCEYLRGTSLYGARIVSLLDLPALLMQGSLNVNEKPK